MQLPRPRSGPSLCGTLTTRSTQDRALTAEGAAADGGDGEKLGKHGRYGFLHNQEPSGMNDEDVEFVRGLLLSYFCGANPRCRDGG